MWTSACSVLEADYYDGRSSRRHRVRLWLEAGQLHVLGEGVERQLAFAEVQLTEKLGQAPRLLRLLDGAWCEIRDHAALEALLAGAGRRESVVDLAQRSMLLAIAALLLTALILAGGYFWCLPRVGDAIAAHLPASVGRLLSEQTLALLDDGLLKPSQIPAARQQQLRESFAALVAPGEIRILFRSSAPVGPNALALPDGTIIVLDELLALLDHDEQLLAVLAHEYAHVQHHHGLRLTVRGSLAAAVSAWWLGDVSSLLAAAPAALLQARHSREFEAQADAGAARLLRSRGIAPARLAEVLEILMGQDKNAEKDGNGWSSYLSSHPATAARIRALRAAEEWT